MNSLMSLSLLFLALPFSSLALTPLPEGLYVRVVRQGEAG